MDKSDLLLGQQVASPERYSPDILTPIPRALGREGLSSTEFNGLDVWYAWELSWLNEQGIPQVRVGRFCMDARSPNIVESKSLKLYLNALNNERYRNDATVIALIESDLGSAVGAAVTVELFAVDDQVLAPQTPQGLCIDGLAPGDTPRAPVADCLCVEESAGMIEQALYSHLLRSLCPVTGQPDWATLTVAYRGKPIEQSALLAYVLSYRCHQGFHEQCVEQIFADIDARCRPEALLVQANYTRRGGLDINPARWKNWKQQGIGALNGRLARQ
ncbi:MAG: NADPH-dependent 7-cyano-7-deazaguanine reductase QueF [Gammaproteobacteria bacterium]|nr:MAG: NADPH-dependent 7-cyano-7-deazaguanine reductase QueF [Gammaproteobacteria bacterium]